MTDNFVSITGNLTRDPETGETAGGKSYARFGLAFNRRWKKAGSDDWSEEVNFFNITAWGDLADNAATSLEKGHRVVVTGRLEQRSWENDEGEKKSAVQIVADGISPDLRWATAEISRLKGTGGSGAAREDVAPIDEEPF